MPMTQPKHGSDHLRHSLPTQEELALIKRNPIYLVLDNVLDTYNIGSLFRLSDAAAVKKIYICGDSEYPPSSKIHKSAVGTEAWTPWTHVASAALAVRELKDMGVQIIAVEQDPRSIAYTLLPSALSFPCAIVVGHETSGVSREVLDLAEVIVELPQFGVNKSFNVWGSAAVVVYKILEKIN